MNRRYLKAALILVLLFAALLPLYYVFSYGKNDALQQTLHDAGQGTGGSWWTAPFSYGANPVETFLVGLLGFVVVAVVVYGVLRIARRKGVRNGTERGPAAPRGP